MEIPNKILSHPQLNLIFESEVIRYLSIKERRAVMIALIDLFLEASEQTGGRDNEC